MTDRLTEVFAEVLNVPPESLSDASSPANTPQWDSLATINLTLAVEAAFGVKLKTREVMAMTTLGLTRAALRQKGVAL